MATKINCASILYDGLELRKTHIMLFVSSIRDVAIIYLCERIVPVSYGSVEKIKSQVHYKLNFTGTLGVRRPSLNIQTLLSTYFFQCSHHYRIVIIVDCIVWLPVH